MEPDADALIEAMQRLGLLLAQEDAALRSFDLAGIAAAAEAKLELEPELEAARTALGGAELGPAQRERLSALHDGIATAARANLRRLKASLDAVTALVDHATGRSASGYGRSGHGQIRPVLASEVG
ncbi:MAG: hypothetical protein IPH07_03405 [Deltaproteobacteria bacterium]|nr:hypothetical protein [Deltaproteobacteria bacterium]MBK8718716.1 hypothetical protein [Deltaproteobacteria bacterium]MBP7290967.1 hypothetical protein [Nannocystaceae bacterium]